MEVTPRSPAEAPTLEILQERIGDAFERLKINDRAMIRLPLNKFSRSDKFYNWTGKKFSI